MKSGEGNVRELFALARLGPGPLARVFGLRRS